jgi:predicted permease
MTAIARQLAEDFPDTNKQKLGVKLTPLQQRYTGDVKNSLLVLLAAVVMALVITCANLANLLMIQLASREGEFATRMALGATQGTVVRQLTAENLIVALSGGVLAFMMSRVAVSVLVRFLPMQIPRANEITVASHVFLFGVAMAVLSALLFGVLPALHWLKSSGVVLSSLRGSTIRVGAARVKDVISAGQIAVALVLLISTALLAKTFLRLQSVDLGFDPSGVLTARISLPATGYKSAADVVRFSDSFRANCASIPGVESVGMISILPLSGVISRIHFAPGGYIPNQGQAHEAQFRVVTPDYFRTMGILIEGRDFAERDSKDSEPVVIINRELASKYWTDGGALGARLTFENFGGPGQQTARVIGIVSNIKQSTLDEATTTDLYIPLR